MSSGATSAGACWSCSERVGVVITGRWQNTGIRAPTPAITTLGHALGQLLRLSRSHNYRTGVCLPAILTILSVTRLDKVCSSRWMHTDLQPQSGMAISVRTLDDGAWISINDSREVGVSEVWTLPAGECCSCRLAPVLLEGFTDVSIDGQEVVAGVVGQCLECGTRGSIDRLPVGRVGEGPTTERGRNDRRFRRYAPEAVSTRPTATHARDSP